MSQLPLDFNPRATTRRTDPVTSFAAAQRVVPHASHGRTLVLQWLNGAPRGLTDFELATATGWQQTSIGKRRGECVANGWVERSVDERGIPTKRPSPSGSPALVWRITPAGREALNAA